MILHSDHRILWISVWFAEGGLWINCISVKNQTPKKALKTGLFFDMIGKLSKGLSTGEVYFSTWCGKRCGYPQVVHRKM